LEEVLAQAQKSTSKYARKTALLPKHVFANLAGQKLKKIRFSRGF